MPPQPALIRRDRAHTAALIMLDVAFYAGRAGTVPAADLAERLGQARRGLEPLLQTLARAGLLDSVRGPHGGYRLRRAARDITLAEIAATMLDAPTAEARTAAPIAAIAEDAWLAADAAAMEALKGVTLEDLVRRAVAAGHRRPTLEPLSYAI